MPDAFARLLRRMLTDGGVPRSMVSSKALKSLQPMLHAEVIHFKRQGPGMAVEVCDKTTLQRFYEQLYPTADTHVAAESPRARAVEIFRNAKRVAHTDMEPIMLRVLRPLECWRDDESFDVHTVAGLTGVITLVLGGSYKWGLGGKIAIVENLENFLFIEQMGLDVDAALYAAGRLSMLTLDWLASPQMSGCVFLHCGDYDPVGLDEYLREKQVLGERVTLYLPAQLENLIRKYGRPELLADSVAVLERLRGSEDESIKQVIDIFNVTGCGLEQEVLLIPGILDNE